MTTGTREINSFPILNRHKIEAKFSSGDITSDGGALLLRQMDKQLEKIVASRLEATQKQFEISKEEQHVVGKSVSIITLKPGLYLTRKHSTHCPERH